ncbi:hypothetical protein G0U57_005484, partial [Chelydra serpentina]
EQQKGEIAQHRWQAQRSPPQTVPALASPPAWENLKLFTITEGDSQAYLTPCKCVAEACHWPRGQWTVPLVPYLNGKAQQAYSSQDAREAGYYDKGKEANPPVVRDQHGDIPPALLAILLSGGQRTQ